MRKNKLYILLACIGLCGAVVSCTKDIEYGDNPYGESAANLGIKFAALPPSPSQVRPGGEVTYQITGLGGVNTADMDFYVNNNPVEIIATTEASITVKLPETVSTGSARLVINGQNFVGPLTPIIGKVAIDPIFNAGTGSVGAIYTIKRLSNGQFFLGGAFNDYNGQSASSDINGLVRITATGEAVTSDMKFGEGVKSGSVTNILELPSGQLFISGGFSKYDQDETVRNAALLNIRGDLYSQTVDILNLTDDPTKSTMLVPVFNGGVSGGGIVKSFFHDGKITLVGSFSGYTSNFYERSTYNQILRDFFPIENIARVNLDGTLDSTFLVNHSVFPKRGSFGVNGMTSDALMDEDGTLTLVGSFTRFNNNVNSSRILRLTSEGKVDPNFKGTGADNDIFKATSTKENQLLLAGRFENFNGAAAKNLVRVNLDGTVDASFKSKGFTGGTPNYVTQLDNGLILVAGSFKRYDNVIREGLVILNPDGSLAQGYNNTGSLVGSVKDSYVGINSIGQRTVTLVGAISSFNGKANIGNIIRLTIQD